MNTNHQKAKDAPSLRLCARKRLFYLVTRTSLIGLLVLGNFSVGAQTAAEAAWLRNFAAQQDAAFQRDNAAARALAARLGMTVRFSLPNGQVVELQRFENGIPVYYTTMNLNAARTISTDDVWPGGAAGLSLSGAGQTLGIWDGGGVRATHQEFSVLGVSRVTQQDSPSSVIDHATHVAGTMVARGADVNALGMSFAAELDAYDWNSDAAEMATAAANGLRVSNHSYGFQRGWGSLVVSGVPQLAWYGTPAISTVTDYLFGFYQATARDWDAMARNAPNYLIVKAAGNDRGEAPGSQPVNHWVWNGSSWVVSSVVRNADGGATGFDCLEGAAVSKNVLTVGAVEDIPNGYSVPADVVAATFSGRGPTDDGRIKPDVVANGVGVYSSIASSDSAYASFNGTSMASPNTSGSIGLLQEHFQNLFTGNPPWSSTVRALLIHTADEAGPSAGPDYNFGWGLVNARRAAQVMSYDALNGANFDMQELTLSQGQTINFVVVSDGAQPLRATIAWTDPAGTPPAASLNPTARMLVNDLDLRIIGGATTYTPWILNPTTPGVAATTGDNIRDNVEQVLIQSPPAGTYTIRITHKGTLAGGPQNVALVVSGASTTGAANWTRTYNGVGNVNDFANATFVDARGNVYVTGYSGNGSPTFNDYTTVKYDSAGTQLWIAHYNGPGNSTDRANAIAVDQAGNVYVTGTSWASGSRYDYATIKYDANGNQLWAARYDANVNHFKYTDDEATAIAVDANGNVYVTGWSYNDSPYRDEDYVTIKYDANGNQLWLGRWTSNNGTDIARALAVDSAGNVYVTGFSTTADLSTIDYTTIKYNSSGSQQWAVQYNGPGNGFDDAKALAVDTSGNVYVTGASYGGAASGNDYATLMYNSSGVQQWVSRYTFSGAGSDAATAIALETSGNVIVTGTSAGSGSGNDFATVKYNTSGVQQWATRYNGAGNGNDSAKALSLDAFGNIYVAGSATGSASGTDYATVKYRSSSGVQVWAATHSSSGAAADNANAMGVDLAGNVYVTGTATSVSSFLDYVTIKYGH
jgi:uncharacterized delta-60 repeat protein